MKSTSTERSLSAGKAEPPGPAGPKPKNKRRRYRWLPYVGVAVLAALIVAGLWPRPVPVETARVEFGALRATVNEEGKTRIKERFLVSAPVAGQLARIPLKAGAEVRAGETVVATIEPLAPAPLDARSRALAEARRDTATANLEKARAARDFAASELRRFQRLYGEKTVSVQEYESVLWRETNAAKDQAAAASALRQAETELAEFTNRDNPDGSRSPVQTLKAPVSGRVLRVFEESARTVPAGTPLVELGDPANLEVVVEVLSRDGAALAPGAKVEFEQWGGGRPLAGRVRLVEPAAFTKVSALGVEEQRVRVIADLETPPEQRPSLGDGFRVEARIVLWETERALKAPTGALFRQGRDWAVFVLTEGRAVQRPIQVGRSSATEAQILGGLKEGEAVILYPGDRIRNGQRVKAITI
jgi:HlyD family secretion protein